MENNNFIPPDYSGAKEREFPYDPMIDGDGLEELDDEPIIDDEGEEEYEPLTAKEDFEIKNYTTFKIGGKIEIDKSSCDGCGVCIQVCKYGALEVGK